MENVGSMELLQFAIENGMLNEQALKEKMETKLREKYLSLHDGKIWFAPKEKYWRTWIRKEGKRIPLRAKTREELEEKIIKFYQENVYSPTVEEMFFEYNDERLSEGIISEASHLRYEQDFNRFFKEIRTLRIKEISADDLQIFVKRTIGNGEVTKKAYANFRVLLKGIFDEAHDRKLIPYIVERDVLSVINISKRKFKATGKEEEDDVFSEEEYETYVTYLSEHPDLWNQALLLILVSGLRGGEVVVLKRENLSRGEDYFCINVKDTETRYKKDGKYVYESKGSAKSKAGMRETIVPKTYMWLYELMIKNKKPGDYLFVNPKTGKRITTNSLRRRQERNCKKLCFLQKSPHKGRKSYASILLDNGIDKSLIKGQMGHTNILTTETHYHRNMKSAEKKALILQGIPLLGEEKRNGSESVSE